MPIDFDKNQIIFQCPQTVGAAVVNSNQPQFTPLPNGYSVSKLSYTVTAQADPANPNHPSHRIIANWSSDRNFNVVEIPIQPNANVTIYGSTNITLPKGQGHLYFHVRAEVISLAGELINDVVYSGRVFGAPDPTLEKWNLTGPTEGPLNIGAHTLAMDSFIFWRPHKVGDSVTVTSEYVATVEGQTKVEQQKQIEV